MPIRGRGDERMRIADVLQLIARVRSCASLANPLSVSPLLAGSVGLTGRSETLGGYADYRRLFHW